ncbi:alpha-ketoglutarate-dependent dioxygenase alkB homolog 6-like [Poeciliopsis prolifica]|uniref:alpha-ketoglutarate-dependent dioxygenase alkB homolog 6-like n=1 Tax=Poeciliopsis prolifica TaxID=188132 RepID=UPI002412FDA5|nr:alpha-ketoglutarate-dependent dioxygenase alkB homolog 6-like [Poeciliopsis prolifica]
MERPSCVVEDLKQFVVNEAPQTAFYIPDFISEEEESFLLQQVYKSPKSKWTQLSGRRLQNWGGLPHPKGMLAESLPDWLQSCCEKVSSLGVFGGKTANHVLVNEYKPGEGIMAHEDGPLYHPRSAPSAWARTPWDFYRPVCSQDGPQTQQSRYLLSLLLRPRSLLVLQDDMYRQLLHGIQNRDRDPLTDRVANLSAAGARPGETLSRETRVSLTIRHVPKVIRTRMVLGRK